MHLNILKKDLKRKKTMNVIILIFMILSAMFISSSTNNIISVFSGLEVFFEKAGVPDYTIVVGAREDVRLESILDSAETVTSYGIEKAIYMDENVKKDGKVLETNRKNILMPIESAKIVYFDEGNKPINSVERGSIYISARLFDDCGIKIGDKLEIFFDGVSAEYTVAGAVKDAVFGSSLMGMARYIICDEDFRAFDGVSERTELCYVNTTDTFALEQAIEAVPVMFSGPASVIKMSYAMDMTVAGILMAVSVLLIVTAFIVLRFTINFTIAEEFREIGVMKAIGISSGNIRSLYIMKYLVLAVSGAAAGFFASIPFGNMLLDSVSETMVLENENSYLVNFICSLAVVGIVILFSYRCTKKVVKLTPLDAIRSGQTGERFMRKSVMRLGGSRFKPALFMALNDILSSPKKYGMIALILILCLSPALIIADTANTLRSGRLVTSLGFTQSDVYIANEKMQFDLIGEDGEEKARQYMDEVERKLAENGMPARCTTELIMKPRISYGDKVCKSITFKGIGTTTDMYLYEKGTPPQNSNEIAMTPVIAEKLGAVIGDTVRIKFSEDRQEDFIITAFFQCMSNFGEGVRLHESAEASFAGSNGTSNFQVNFTDSPDSDEIAVRIGKMKSILGEDNIKYYDAPGFVEMTIGFAENMDTVKLLILTLSVVITILAAVLMERSFIESERGEVAVLKAVGFTSGTIVLHHTLRMSISGFAAAVTAALLSTPLYKLAITPVLRLFGAPYGVRFEVNKAEVFFIYPAVIFTVMTAASFLSAQYTRKIGTREVSGTE